jgi:hypothetical protein
VFFNYTGRDNRDPTKQNQRERGIGLVAGRGSRAANAQW